MKAFAELEHWNPDTATKAGMAVMIQKLLDQTGRDAKTIQAKDLKIEALTHELAQLRRIRFGAKSEILPPLQRDVFEETLDTDLAAIAAEVERLQDD